MLTEKIFLFLEPLHQEPLLSIMKWMTSYGIAIFLIGWGIFLIRKKQFDELLVITAAVILAWLASQGLKNIFTLPRPHFNLIEALDQYGFPSGHAAVSLALWPFAAKFRPVARWTARFLLIVFPFTRLYLGVHFTSDLIGGGFLGLAIGYYLLAKNQENHFAKKLLQKLRQEFELRRQIAHFCIGSSIAALLYFRLLNSQILAAIAVIGGLLILIERRKKIPLLTNILEIFERKKDIKNFPGKGSFFLVCGAFFSTILFDPEIAIAAVIIMAVGDSIATIIGKYVGKIPLPYNREKSLEGSLLAFFAGTLAATLVIPFHHALIGSSVAMMIESLPLKIKKLSIDDNLIIPIVAGITLTLL